MLRFDRIRNERKNKMIRTVGLILNHHNPKAVQCVKQAETFLKSHSIQAVYPQEDTTPTHEPPDLIVSFGGDGTLLLGAGYAVRFDIPLLGINLGTVGFLTEEDPEKLEQALASIIQNEYHEETRSLLFVQVPKSGISYYALNDAVITRAGYARLIRVDAFVNDKAYGTFTADGILVATPTGSTGYSLSAGGPIVEPSMNCMVITPVCAHSMQHCPCVVSESSRIRLQLRPEREQTAELQIDGQSREKLSSGDEVLISGTDRMVRLIRLHSYDFFGLVRRKLAEWGS